MDVIENNIEEVYNSSLKLLQSPTVETTYKTIVKEALRLLPSAQNGSIFLEKDGILVRVYASSKLLYAWDPRKRGYLFEAYKKNKPTILTAEQVKKIHPEAKGPNFHSDIVIPLSYKKTQIGLLTIYSKKKAGFAKGDLQILKLLGPIAALAIINNQSLEDTKRALETRDLFISLASHELRTPLTTLNVYSQLLKKRIDKGGKIDKKWIEIIDDETKWLNVLFNELLAVNQIKKEEFSYNMGKNHLNEIARRSINHINVQFPHHKIHYKSALTNKDDILYSDFDKLLQVFVNLLTNAAKFSEKSSNIKLFLKLQDSKFVIIVEDEGQGINKKDLPHIYRGFYKGQNQTVKGMGLGLYISGTIIKRHKGTINIDSEVGKGTKVKVVLPKK